MLDARLVGLAAAGLALVLRLPLIAVVLIAAVATALARLLALDALEVERVPRAVVGRSAW